MTIGHLTRPSRSRRLGVALLVLASAGLAIWAIAPVQRTSSRNDTVTVVAPATVAPPALAPRRRIPAPLRERPAPAPHVAMATVPPAVVAARVTRAHPLLTDVAIACSADTCTLDATVRPAQGQAALDQRQAMLLGGLAMTLAGSGYRMAVPFAFDETDDNVFHLRAALTPASMAKGA